MPSEAVKEAIERKRVLGEKYDLGVVIKGEGLSEEVKRDLESQRVEWECCLGINRQKET